jgi:hypothetical protein
LSSLRRGNETGRRRVPSGPSRIIVVESRCDGSGSRFGAHVYRVNAKRSEGLTDLPHAPALAAGYCESVMKDPRKAHQWRNALILQAAVGALFLPFVISLAMMILLAGHDDHPIRPVDNTMTSSTR